MYRFNVMLCSCEVGRFGHIAAMLIKLPFVRTFVICGIIYDLKVINWKLAFRSGLVM